ncbi:amidase [Neptunicoccus cionae]|uniref:amidase n=1 Tax=Neptunicoccus cionae TaxID=2035344 RepID=UPI000C763D6E|nr:amidase [Amylibacter cionae]PLS21427.1 amidase [Amylibacter cionae]
MLNREEWVSQDLVGLSELAAKGDVSRREILQTAIREIESRNEAVNAVVLTRFEEALDHLDKTDKADRFTGMPYLIKDLHAPVKGMPLSNGSEKFVGTDMGFDSTTVSRLRNAGIALLGRTASPEFGLTITTESRAWRATRNPWNLDRSAGGSSGGAGAAVASGMVPAAHATDSAGSIRIPAAFNGLVGLKPTRGVNAIGPHRGDPNFGMSHEHAVSRTVRDTAVLLDITAGPDAGCPYFTPAPAGGFEALCKSAPAPLRIGFLTDRFDGKSIDPDSAAAVTHTAKLLTDLGHSVEEARPDFDFETLTSNAFRLLVSSLAGFFPPEFCEGPMEGFEPMTRKSMRYAAQVGLHDYLQRAAVVNTEVRKMSAFFNTYDILLTASTNGAAQPLGVAHLDQDIEFDAFVDLVLDKSPFSVPFNASGQPAISLPVHQTAEGMPIGVQLVSGFGQDGKLLQLAAQIEAASDWKTVAN